LINLQRVAREIKSIGLYDLVLQDAQRVAGKTRLSEVEILQILDNNPEILQDYMQTNVEYNLSNIHIKDIEIENLKDDCKQKAKDVNANLATLRELEKYTLDFEQSATLVIIFSIEFFVLFSVQYFIVLLNLKEWQWWIYSLFASSVAVAYWYGKKQSRLYAKNKKIYDALYMQTLKLMEELEEDECIKKSDLLIEECEEHV
jgi:ABC-type multidrug transport system permease subunit